jgi:hypothetical protein
VATVPAGGPPRRLPAASSREGPAGAEHRGTWAGPPLRIGFGHSCARYVRYGAQKLIRSGPERQKLIRSRAHGEGQAASSGVAAPDSRTPPAPITQCEWNVRPSVPTADFGRFARSPNEARVAGLSGRRPQFGAGASGRFIRARTTERPSGSASTTKRPHAASCAGQRTGSPACAACRGAPIWRPHARDRIASGFATGHSLNRRTLPTLVRGSASIRCQSRGRATAARLRSDHAARSLTAGGCSGSRGTT